MKHLAKYLQILPIITLLYACASPSEPFQTIIDKTIDKSGCERYINAVVSFDFRENSYSIERRGGLYAYSCTTVVSPDSVVIDKLHNYGFIRTVNDTMVSVSDSMAQEIGNYIHSVCHYFSLPFGLNDPFVNKTMVGNATINGESYYKIKVWYDREKGGNNVEDECYYWIHASDYSVDFLAYSCKVDGGGIRFRQAIHPRTINGIRVVDYINYVPKSAGVTLSCIDSLYEAGELEVFSTIENDNVTISLIED